VYNNAVEPFFSPRRNRPAEILETEGEESPEGNDGEEFTDEIKKGAEKINLVDQLEDTPNNEKKTPGKTPADKTSGKVSP